MNPRLGRGRGMATLCPVAWGGPRGPACRAAQAPLGLRKSLVPLSRTASLGSGLNVLTVPCPRQGDIFMWKDSTLAYFVGQMAELCDPWSPFRPHAVRKQLFGKRLHFISL